MTMFYLQVGFDNHDTGVVALKRATSISNGERTLLKLSSEQ